MVLLVVLLTDETESENLDTIASDMVGIAGAVATRDPSKALRVFDDDGDGKLSFAELRRHRWVITIAFMCFISGAIGFMIGFIEVPAPEFAPLRPWRDPQRLARSSSGPRPGSLGSPDARVRFHHRTRPSHRR